MSFKSWLTQNKIFFETAAATAIAVASLVVGGAQTYLASEQGHLSEKQNTLMAKQNELVDLQTRVAEAQALPNFDIRIEQVRNEETGKAVENKIIIENSGGPIREFYSRIIFLLQIEAASRGPPFKQVKLSFRVTDYYAANIVSAMSKGRLLTTVGPNNNTRAIGFENSLRAATDAHNLAYANAEERTFVHLTYRDILNRAHSDFYYVTPVTGSIALSQAEGDSTFQAAEKLPAMSLSTLSVDKIVATIEEKLRADVPR